MLESAYKNTGFVNSIISCVEPTSQSANLPTSQIGVRWFGTKKCSQRYEIDHFCVGIFAGIQPSEFVRDPVWESSVLLIRS